MIRLGSQHVIVLLGRLPGDDSQAGLRRAESDLTDAGLATGPIGIALAQRIVRYANDELQRMLAE